MPQETQLAHRVLSNTALPYITNASPSDTDPHYVSGSQNLLTSINTYAERRPGFSDRIISGDLFQNLQRIFTFDTFDGTFWVARCDINGGTSRVWIARPGIDTTSQLIFQDNQPTPFDFVFSNNTLYFSNGNVAKKWLALQPTLPSTWASNVSNWGIAIGSINNASGPNAVGTLADGGGAFPWSNTSPTHVTLANLIGGVNSNNLLCTNFGFSIASNETITGIAVNVTAFMSSAVPQCSFNAALIRGGNPTGATRTFKVNPGPSPTSPTVYPLGSKSDLWNINLTANDINQTNFGVALNTFVAFGSATVTVSAVTITVYGLGGPIVTVSASGGSFSAVNGGYTYEYCYGNSNTGHISSPTPISNSTGNFSNKLNVSIPVVASTDPQVNQIRVFRTTDGGGGTYFELPNSPFPNTTQSITDNSPDASLQVGSIAPLPTFNDPPPAGVSMVYFSGRIWLIKYNTNQVWFSGLEEIVQGVPEESFPSGIAGNFWSFDQLPQALGVAGLLDSQTLAVLCPGRLYGITGNTLDTFRRFLVSNRRGCRNRMTVTMLGGMMAWLDSAGQIWATDGSTLNELSTPIRPDLATITQSNCSMSFHSAGRFHWLVFSTGSVLYVYDIDQDQWMPPWSFACQYLWSGEVSAGTYVLMAATPALGLQLNTAKFNDNGVTYQPVIKTNLMSVVPDFGKRFSYIASGIYNEPSRTGVPWTIQVTNNGQLLGDVLLCFDDDPTQPTTVYESIYPQLQPTSTTYNRRNGITLKQNVFQTIRNSCRWVGIKVLLQQADQVDNIYEIFLAYAKLGGR